MKSLQQQTRFDSFVREFKSERPHEALAMKTSPKSTQPHQHLIVACPKTLTRCMIATYSSLHAAIDTPMGLATGRCLKPAAAP